MELQKKKPTMTAIHEHCFNTGKKKLYSPYNCTQQKDQRHLKLTRCWNLRVRGSHSVSEAMVFSVEARGHWSRNESKDYLDSIELSYKDNLSLSRLKVILLNPSFGNKVLPRLAEMQVLNIAYQKR